MIDLSFQNNQQITNGSVLISDPFLDEAFFRRSVVLICDHNEDGTFGFVLNNFVELELHELEETFPEIQSRVSIGGPVDTQRLFFIHNYGDDIEFSVKIREGLYFGGDFEQIKPLLDNQSQAKIRFFLGYSGWGKDQLKDELNSHSWIVANNITNQELFNTTDNQMWQHFLEKQGKRFQLMTKFPINPQDN